MPWDCSLFCLFTERRRHIEVLWRRRLLVTEDERRAKRRFLTLMRGFDTEDLEVLRKAVVSGGINIKQCAPGPPMDLIEGREESSSDDELEPEIVPGCSTTIVSTRPRHSVKQMERDRILFQRQRVSTIASIQQQGGVSTVITQQVGSDRVGQYQRRYSTNRDRGRRSSNFSGRRCAIYMSADENANSLRPTTILRTRNSARSTSSSEGEGAEQFDHPVGSIRRVPDDEGELEMRRQSAAPINAIDMGLIPQIDKPMSMPYLCCKMWRWKDLQIDAALHRLDPLPWCRFGRVTINNATVSCCNPYHYGLWIKPETQSSDEQSVSSGQLVNGGGTATTLPNDVIMGDTTIGHVRSAFQHSLQSAAKATMVQGKNQRPAVNESPPMTPPPAPPLGNNEPHMGNHLSAAIAGNRRISHSVHHQAMSWGRLARWQFNERVGDVVTLIGQFIVVGQLAGTVFDGQDVKSSWDLDNLTSFALIRQSSDETSENLDEVWLYNSSDQPLFMCVSRNIARQSSSEASNIRRLSPGYCIRVHRTTSPSSNIMIGMTATHQQNAIADMGNDVSHRGDSPTQVNPVSLLTISIGSGWGANYDQKSVADLNCRYEVIFT